jgi:hypothetical protein
MEYSKKYRKLANRTTTLLITLIIILVILIPFSNLFAFDPDYPDFIWTYNMDEGKIVSGSQKALYLTGYSMASEDKMQDIYRMIEETDLNALVFNVKEDSGEISYDCQVDFFRETGSVRQVYDLDGAIKEMDKRGIYSIARIVLFKDGVITKARPDLAVQNKNTGSRIYLDGGYWLDLYSQEMWGHYVDLVLELAEMGIDEIQFDYIRAPSRGIFSLAKFPANDMDRERYGQ